MRVERKAVLIGRSPKCGLQLKDPAVSRLHAAIIPQQDGSWVIARQRTAQPVWVDGVPINKLPLRGGETIRIGDFAIVFRSEDAGAAADQEETIRFHPAVAAEDQQPAGMLIFQAGGPATGRVKLVRGVTVLGRGEECDVVLDDGRCSRRHAEVHRVGPTFVLRDPGSTNGVLVNGQRVDADVELREGDVIQMGGALMRFTSGVELELEADPAAVAAVEAAVTAAKPASDAGLLGRWSKSPPLVQVVSAFAAAVLLAVAFFVATAPARRAARQPRSTAMREPARDPAPERETDASVAARGGEEPDQPDETTSDIPRAADDPAEAATTAEADDSRSVSPPAAPKPSTEKTARSPKPARRESDELDDAWKDGEEGRQPPRAFADLLDNDESGSKATAAQPSSKKPPAPPAVDQEPEGPETDPPQASAESTAEDSAPTRLAVPADADVEEAAASIRAVFAEELEGPDDLSPTLAKLLKAARQSAKPASKYALLLAAERKAVQASAFRRACEVIDTRAEMFEIDGMQSRLNMLRDAYKSAGDTKAEIFDIVVEATEQAVETERFDVAAKAAALAGAVAVAIEQPSQGKAGGRRVETARQLRQTVADRRKIHQKYEQAREALRETPNDEKALEVVGKYLCFVKQDWQEGLRALAAGRETALKDLAGRELALPPGREADTMTAFALAGDWWALAENAKRAGDLPVGSGDLLKSHAAGIYRRIVNGLEDPIDAELAKKRIAAAGSAR